MIYSPRKSARPLFISSHRSAAATATESARVGNAWPGKHGADYLPGRARSIPAANRTDGVDLITRIVARNRRPGETPAEQAVRRESSAPFFRATVLEKYRSSILKFSKSSVTPLHHPAARGFLPPSGPSALYVLHISSDRCPNSFKLDLIPPLKSQ